MWWKSSACMKCLYAVSRVWTAVRAARGRAAPGARAGHAGLRVGAHLYIFGGDLDAGAGATNELWRFHFGTYRFLTRRHDR